MDLFVNNERTLNAIFESMFPQNESISKQVSHSLAYNKKIAGSAGQ